jgi:hypothetical protein
VDLVCILEVPRITVSDLTGSEVKLISQTEHESLLFVLEVISHVVSQLLADDPSQVIGCHPGLILLEPVT